MQYGGIQTLKRRVHALQDQHSQATASTTRLLQSLELQRQELLLSQECMRQQLNEVRSFTIELSADDCSEFSLLEVTY